MPLLSCADFLWAGHVLVRSLHNITTAVKQKTDDMWNHTLVVFFSECGASRSCAALASVLLGRDAVC